MQPVAVAVSLAILLGLGSSQAVGAITWSGTWSRDQHPGETMTLMQTGNAVLGTYTWDGRFSEIKGTSTTVTGVVKGPRLRLAGTWRDSAFPRGGQFAIVMDQTLKQYSGDPGFSLDPATPPESRPFSGVCIAGPCLSNTPAPQPAETRWRWRVSAARNVNPKTPVRARFGGARYRLSRVNFSSGGALEAFGGPTRARGSARATFLYRRVSGRGPARVKRTMTFTSFDGERFSSAAARRVFTATAKARSPECRAQTRMTFTDRAGGDSVVIRFLARCRVPGGRIRGIGFRNRSGQRAQVVIAPR